MKVLKDLAYARVGRRELLLDLYLPADAATLLPVIAWIHSGAWRMGSKDNPPAARMAERGYTVARIGYRLSQEATFPAQIHDCKAAVRALQSRSNALYQLRQDTFPIVGEQDDQPYHRTRQGNSQAKKGQTATGGYQEQETQERQQRQKGA